MDDGLATDIVLFLSKEKLLAVARLVAGEGPLEKAYRCLHKLLRKHEFESFRCGYNACSVLDLERKITL